MTDDATTPPEGPAPEAAEPPGTESPAQAQHPVRLASILGSLGAAALCLAWFLPWVEVDQRVADDFHATVSRELERRTEPSPGAEEFLQIAEAMQETGALSGTDFIHWLRAGQAFSAELDADVNPGMDADAHVRRLRLVQYLLYGMPLAAFLLLTHFVMHRFRRARAPVLILAILTGLAALVTAATLDFTEEFIADAIEQGRAQLGLGWACLVAGGVGMAVAGVFGVRPRNWFRVYTISAATAVALGLLALRYLETGGVL